MKMNNKLTASAIGGIVVLITLLFGLLATQVNASELDTAKKKTETSIQQRAAAQTQIETAADAAEDLEMQYKETLSEIGNLKVYNEQLRILVADQKNEEEKIAKQLSQLNKTHEGIVPAMVSMLDSLEGFVKLDLPFLAEERSVRLAKLKEMMGQANVSVSEKFRRILEAYQIELEYGRTIESYQESLVLDGEKVVVNVLRFGRTGLYSQTLDKSKTAMWDTDKSSWVMLDDDYRSAIQKGLKMASKKLPPNLLMLPVKKPEVLL